ncbi:MAG TPA: RsmE family RNA methyltransferase [Ignavibacteriaceae bacterium]|nr:RsmE family RNA methyltransferase [Ignavibacteriaceae bacterium]
MILEKSNGYLELEHLSNIELYYSEPANFISTKCRISGDDVHHIRNVMRHKTGDIIYITNGEGKIYKSCIAAFNINDIEVRLEKESKFINDYKNITFCIPRLKSSDRFEFAIEKSVELGITNFVVFNSKRTVVKGSKKDRWEKIAVSAMKQSLRSFLPNISEIKTFSDLLSLEGKKILFEQNSEKRIEKLKLSANENYLFIFGPEGGLDNLELVGVDSKNIYCLSDNRLRTETAVVKAASMLTSII